MLPNFLVVGAQKSGTTSLHHYLYDHPDIYLPEQKETKFFVDDERYIKGIDFYETEYFSGWKGEKAAGEVDPDYMFFEQGFERIKKHFNIDELKIIFIFRDPVERAFSHYLMTYRRGLEKLSFEEALDQEQDRIKKDYYHMMHYSYQVRGRYYTQIKRILEVVKKEKILFLLMDDLKENPDRILKECFSFLGVDEDYRPENLDQTYHKAEIPRSTTLLSHIQRESIAKKMFRIILPWKDLRLWIRKKLISLNETGNISLELDEKTKHMLYESYQGEISGLSRIIGKDLHHWKP